MTSLRALSPIEASELEKALEKVREDWGFAKSADLKYLVKRWEAFVGDVEKGYPLSIEDFTQDLSIRDTLEEIRKAVPPALGRDLGSLLDPLDERFRQATSKSDRPIDDPPEAEAGEWWFRIPRSAGPELMRFILENGLLSR